MQAFGYTVETMQFMLLPLVRELRDPVGSMGNDSALACLSDKPRMLYDYFKQLFAQVTNPAIDSIREEVIMSLECYIGPERNLLETTEEHAHRLRMPHPILSNEQLAALKHMDHRGWQTKTIDITWPRSEGKAGHDQGARPHLRRGRSRRSTTAIRSSSFPTARSAATACRSARCWRPAPCIIIWCARRSGRGSASSSKRARPARCITTACWSATAPTRSIRTWRSSRCGTRAAKACCSGPKASDESRSKRRRQGAPGDRGRRRTAKMYDPVTKEDHELVSAYRKGVAKGMLKVMAKMGISTLQSYKGAQIFEAVGLNDEVIDRCFAGTASRIQGVDFDVLAEEALRRHALGYPRAGRSIGLPVLPNPGEFHWRADGERHMWDPPAIADLQVAARNNSVDAYRRFAEHANRDAQTRCALRGLLTVQAGRERRPDSARRGACRPRRSSSGSAPAR